MNVLILTPDAVGSTLLQRLLTIYMQFHSFDRPVINLHELTNGLAKYYSPEFNRELIGKRTLKSWGYFQQLHEVIELLDSVDHYKTSRLAHYHLERRNDPIEEQIPFYNYLNENFYIIACRRNNVFEHALSMTLTGVTKKLNVYNSYEKIDTFFDIYQHGVDLDVNSFLDKLNAYKKYINWSEKHFEVSRYFVYEEDVPRIEKFILDLPVFAGQPELITWNKNFGITFNEYNQVNYAISDISSINLNSLNKISFVEQLLIEDQTTVEQYQKYAPADWQPVNSLTDLKNLPIEIKKEFYTNVFKQGLLPILSSEKQNKIKEKLPNYQLAQTTINQMIDLGIIINGPPIKKQTLKEKKKTIKNFDQCVEVYNQWIIQHPELGSPISTSDINEQCQQEENFWSQTNNQNLNLTMS